MKTLIKSLLLITALSAFGAQGETTWANARIEKAESTSAIRDPLKKFNPNHLIEQNGDVYVTDYLIVELKNSDIPYATKQAIAKSVNGKLVGAYEPFNWIQIEISKPSMKNLANDGTNILLHPSVRSISFDHLVQQ